MITARTVLAKYIKRRDVTEIVLRVRGHVIDEFWRALDASGIVFLPQSPAEREAVAAIAKDGRTENERLRQALENIAKQHIDGELCEECGDPDYETGYTELVKMAREALKK